jgi:hypothetical protein
MLWVRSFYSTLACLVLLAPLAAQIPGAAVPAAGVAQANAPGAVAVANAPAPGFCEKCWQACEDCKRRLCAMPLGGMLNGMTRPLNGLSGGIVPNFCPETPSKDDLAKPGVEGASAQAKKDALEAKARRQAVRYLGTLDCRYYPEAEGALIAALRTDGVECVRWEAAMMLGKGCCCSKKIMEALTISVSSSEKDGNPAERSERVRMAAALALDRCLACYCEPVPEPEKPVDNLKEKAPPPREKAPVEGAPPPASSRRPDPRTLAAGKDALKQFYGHYGLQTQSQQIEVTETVRLTPVPTALPAATTTVMTKPTVLPVKQRAEPRSLFGMLKESFGGGESTPMASESNLAIGNNPANAATVTVPVPVNPAPLMVPNAVSAANVKSATFLPATTLTGAAASGTRTSGGTFIFYDNPPAPKR